MKLNLCSDLHQDINGITSGFDGGDILLLAGDLFEFHGVVKFCSFFEEVSEKFRKVFYIPGNHEYYGGDIVETNYDIKKFCSNFKNIIPMRDSVIYLDKDTILFGATFWTNFGNESSNSMNMARKYMNDYQFITNEMNHCLLTPDYVYELHCESLKALHFFTKEYSDKRFIVMTHHAPSQRSISLKYQQFPALNDSFMSQLDSFILNHPNIVSWNHGHTHSSFLYKIGECVIRCNPKGYGDENLHFDKNFSFEV